MFSSVNQRHQEFRPLISPVPVAQGSASSANQFSEVSYTSLELDNILDSLQSSNCNLAHVIKPLMTLDVHKDSTLGRKCGNLLSRHSTNTNENPQRPLKLAHPSSQTIAYKQLVTLDKIVDVLIEKYKEISGIPSQNDANQDSNDLLEGVIIKQSMKRIHLCLECHDNNANAYFGWVTPWIIDSLVIAAMASTKYGIARVRGNRNHISNTGEPLRTQLAVLNNINQKINEALNPQQPNFELMSPNAS